MKKVVQGKITDGILKLKIGKLSHSITINDFLSSGDGEVLPHIILGSAMNMNGDYLSINGGDLILVNENKMNDDDYEVSCYSIAKAIGYTGVIDFV